MDDLFGSPGVAVADQEHKETIHRDIGLETLIRGEKSTQEIEIRDFTWEDRGNAGNDSRDFGPEKSGLVSSINRYMASRKRRILVRIRANQHGIPYIEHGFCYLKALLDVSNPKIPKQ